MRIQKTIFGFDSHSLRQEISTGKELFANGKSHSFPAILTFIIFHIFYGVSQACEVSQFRIWYHKKKPHENVWLQDESLISFLFIISQLSLHFLYWLLRTFLLPATFDQRKKLPLTLSRILPQNACYAHLASV